MSLTSASFMYIFEELETYNRAAKLASFLEFSVRDFPNSTFYFANRLKSVGESVRDNLALAHSNWQGEERKNAMWKTRASLEDCNGLVEVGFRQGLFSEGLRDDLRLQIETLRDRVQAIIRDQSLTPTASAPLIPAEPGSVQ